MAFWNKLFRKGKNDKSEEKEEKKNQYKLSWIPPNQNPWNIELLDLRPISQTMLSSSKDPKMASNAISYNQEDGLIFLNQNPKSNKSAESNVSFSIDSKLENGVLFIPSAMEHKWAIYFLQNKLLFIRSWLREVFVIAETIQENNQLIVKKINGEFTANETKKFTESVLKFLIHSHVLKETVPAPIPIELKENTDNAGLWAFSSYGNMAHFAHFEESINYSTKSKIRSHSLLHIAIARGKLDKVKEELDKGANINSLAGDGLSTLQWSIVRNPEILEFLLKEGANPNTESFEGATAIMNAVQSNKMEHLKLLIENKADVNKQDKRGFTALHRAAEMGHVEIVKVLLQNGARKELEAEGHTALSLAKARDYKEIIEILK